ncbi:pentatricopeptide repeat (PPR) superfamily protein [Actinidia rufa]|uniref:Pentatricopeptide repeat (PPR) superfamily protein n=1 Tax=Actinidia rufa TaxID=165716 RepID=A0A7J0G8N4_9ERIC|nr:pentatricopeptide repeat (PPR) superfamily protein [Actinidia rufa]
MPVRDTVCWNSMIKGCLDCGDLNMAMALFDDMPAERNVVSWTTMEMPRRNVNSWTSVISGLDQHGRSDEGSFLFRQMVVSGVEPTSSRSKNKDERAGRSWVTLKGRKHEFLSGDRSHPSSEKIYKKVDWLGEKLKEVGYVPDQRFALHDVEDEQNNEMLSYHNERLAVGFGLISTVEGSTNYRDEEKLRIAICIDTIPSETGYGEVTGHWRYVMMFIHLFCS